MPCLSVADRCNEEQTCAGGYLSGVIHFLPLLEMYSRIYVLHIKRRLAKGAQFADYESKNLPGSFPCLVLFSLPSIAKLAYSLHHDLFALWMAIHTPGLHSKTSLPLYHFCCLLSSARRSPILKTHQLHRGLPPINKAMMAI